MPNQMKRSIEKQNILQIIVRSNQDSRREINKFISQVKQNSKVVNTNVVNEKENYEKEKTRERESQKY